MQPDMIDNARSGSLTSTLDHRFRAFVTTACPRKAAIVNRDAQRPRAPFTMPKRSASATYPSWHWRVSCSHPPNQGLKLELGRFEGAEKRILFCFAPSDARPSGAWLRQDVLKTRLRHGATGARVLHALEIPA